MINFEKTQEWSGRIGTANLNEPFLHLKSIGFYRRHTFSEIDRAKEEVR